MILLRPYLRLALPVGALALASPAVLAQVTFPQDDPKHMEYARYSSVVIVYENCRGISKSNYTIAKERRDMLREQLDAQGVTGVDDWNTKQQQTMLQYGCGTFFFSAFGKQLTQFADALDDPAPTSPR